MHWIDYAIIVLYLGVLLAIGLRKSLRKDSTAGDLILGGRMLTLPAFVASLVSTWYGGILGVGEYSYKFGLSNWLVFGVPYYLSAALFAVFLARRAREAKVLTIPHRLAQAYGNGAAIAGAAIIYLMTVPSAYILMAGVLCQHLFGWPFWVGVIAGTFFSVVYVYTGGFVSMIRTDWLQFGFMYLGFVILLPLAYFTYGGESFLRQAVPPEHFTWHGGNAPTYIALWYFIALATLIEPAFFQRCYAAKSPSVARKGIFVSMALWAVFDFMTTTTGIYARAILPDLADPVASFPALAVHLLPVGLLGIFALALLATVTSTIDSYAFIAATTFSHDIVGRAIPLDDRGMVKYTRMGLLISAGLAIAAAVFFRSVVDIWHAFGSVGTPALLIPVFTSFVGRRRLPPRWALRSILLSGGISALWLAASHFRADGSYWWGVQPIFPGLGVSFAIFLLCAQRVTDDTLPPTGE